MECDGGFLDLQPLFRDPQIHAALFTLQPAPDRSLFHLHSGPLQGEFRVRELGLVLLGRDFGLCEGLVQRSLRLLKLSLFLHQLLFGGAGVEAQDGGAFFHVLSGGRQPRNAEIGNHGRVDSDGAAGLQCAPAANQHQKLALPRGRFRIRGAALSRAPPIHCEAAAANRQQNADPGNPGSDSPSSGGHWEPPEFASEAGGSANTTAAERSGSRCWSGLSM